jgi:hypothetical protein
VTEPRDLTDLVPADVRVELAAAVAALELHGPAVTKALRRLDRATTAAWNAVNPVDPTEDEWRLVERAVGLDRGWNAAYQLPIHCGRWSPIRTDETAVIDSAAQSWRSGTESALERGANAQALLRARGRPAGTPHGSRRDCLARCRLVSAETGLTPIAPLVVR